MCNKGFFERLVNLGIGVDSQYVPSGNQLALTSIQTKIIALFYWFNVFYSPTVTSPDVIWLSLEPHTFMYPDFVFPTYYVANHYFANF